MATGETGFADVTFDCIPVKHHSVTWGRDDDLCVHDARTPGPDGLRPARRRGLGELKWIPPEPKLLSERTNVGKVTYRQRSDARGVASY